MLENEYGSIKHITPWCSIQPVDTLPRGAARSILRRDGSIGRSRIDLLIESVLRPAHSQRLTWSRNSYFNAKLPSSAGSSRWLRRSVRAVPRSDGRECLRSGSRSRRAVAQSQRGCRPSEDARPGLQTAAMAPAEPARSAASGRPAASTAASIQVPRGSGPPEPGLPRKRRSPWRSQPPPSAPVLQSR